MERKMRECLISNLKRLRKEKGLSQSGLAEKLGAHLTHVSRIETGKYAPSLDFVIKAAKVLNISIDALLSEDGENFQEVRIEDKAMAERLRLMETLDKHEREAVITVIDSMLTKHRIKKVMEDRPER